MEIGARAQQVLSEAIANNCCYLQVMDIAHDILAREFPSACQTYAQMQLFLDELYTTGEIPKEHDPEPCTECYLLGDWSTEMDTNQWFARHQAYGYDLFIGPSNKIYERRQK
jgi:hypothetical protein